jgi:pimeloyl-ACP methyl ester carboxylesterase
MNRKLPVTAILMALALALQTPGAAVASDTAKEARWASQIVDSLLDGDAVWLDDGSGHEFLGIMTEGNADSGRAVILVHGIGVHPNWADVIYPLRVGLLENDITNLSIQMPILANDAESDDYTPLFAEVPARFDAAFAYLKEQGYREISIVAHSMGASMTSYYLSRQPANAPDSVALIGMGAGEAFPGNIEAMAQIRAPLLDLYGSKDLPHVMSSVDARSASGKQSGAEYRQVRVEGANHFFQGSEAELVQQILSWLEAQAAS